MYRIYLTTDDTTVKTFEASCPISLDTALDLMIDEFDFHDDTCLIDGVWYFVDDLAAEVI